MQNELLEAVKELEQQLLTTRDALEGALRTIGTITLELRSTNLTELVLPKPLLRYDDVNDLFMLGRGRLAITELEKRLLRLLWISSPIPMLQSAAAEILECELGSVHVKASLLRKKLRTMSGGFEYIETVRGRGWALRPELCLFERT